MSRGEMRGVSALQLGDKLVYFAAQVEIVHGPTRRWFVSAVVLAVWSVLTLIYSTIAHQYECFVPSTGTWTMLARSSSSSEKYPRFVVVTNVCTERSMNSVRANR